MRCPILLLCATATVISVLGAQDCTNPLLDPVNCCTFTAPTSFNVTFVSTAGELHCIPATGWLIANTQHSAFLWKLHIT